MIVVRCARDSLRFAPSLTFQKEYAKSDLGEWTFSGAQRGVLLRHLGGQNEEVARHGAMEPELNRSVHSECAKESRQLVLDLRGREGRCEEVTRLGLN